MFNVGDTIINKDREVVCDSYDDEFPEIHGHFVAEIIDIKGEWAICEAIGFIENLNHPLEVVEVGYDKLMELRLDNCKHLPQTINDPRMYERTLL